LFEDLFAPLTEMTKRRHEIVHRADLHDGKNGRANPWELADDWQLIHWHLVVAVFYHRVRKATGATGMVEDRARQNVESALVKNVEFAHALVALPQLPPEKRQEGLVKLAEFAKDILEMHPARS
jgi:hypothetical protein